MGGARRARRLACCGGLFRPPRPRLEPSRGAPRGSDGRVGRRCRRRRRRGRRLRGSGSTETTASLGGGGPHTVVGDPFRQGGSRGAGRGGHFSALAPPTRATRATPRVRLSAGRGCAPWPPRRRRVGRTGRWGSCARRRAAPGPLAQRTAARKPRTEELAERGEGGIIHS